MTPSALWSTLLLFALGAVARGAVPDSIDPFLFLAGLASPAESDAFIDPPQCESFFRASGEQRSAELFLDAARSWSRRKHSKAITTHYYDPSGERLVVNNADLSNALLEFYVGRKRFSKMEWAENIKLVYFTREYRFSASDLIRLTRRRRLSFVAGVYARSMLDGKIYNQPTPWIHAAAHILRSEGCKVWRVNADAARGVDLVLYGVKLYKVVPSKRIKHLFDAIDRWQPPQMDWAPKGDS